MPQQEVLKQLDRVSALMADSTRDLTLDDDAPHIGSERMLSLCLHNASPPSPSPSRAPPSSDEERV